MEADFDDAEVSEWKRNMTKEQLEAYNEFIDCMAKLYEKYGHLVED